MYDAAWDYRNPYLWREKVENESFAPMMIEVAVTGEVMGKEYNPNVPETVEEQVEAVYQAYQEGAVICHIHGRNPQDLTKGTADSSVYSRINEQIRKRCPGMIINNTTGGGPELTIEQKLCCLYADCKPDMASLNTGIFMLNMTLKERKAPLPNPHPETNIDVNLLTSYGKIRETAKLMLEQGVKPAVEMFQPGQFMVVRDLLKNDLLEKPVDIEMVFGLQTFNYAHPAKFMDMIRELPKDVIYFATGMGVYQLPMNIMSIVNGGHVRVGLEDTVEYTPGVLAESSAQMVKRIRRIAEDCNRTIATPDQAREMLGLRKI